MGNWLSREEREQREREEEEKTLRKSWTPVQTTDWTTEELERLKQTILKQWNDSLGQRIVFKFLVFGLQGHGKSSFCNGIRSALLGQRFLSDYYQSSRAVGQGSFTRDFLPAYYGDSQNVCIIDMAGVAESDEFSPAAVGAIVSGKVSFQEKLSEFLNRYPSRGENADVTKEDVSCVVLIIKPGTVLEPHVKELFQAVDNVAKNGLITRHVVMTHLDMTDEKFNDVTKLSEIGESLEALRAVKQISQTTGVPPAYISFVRNYWEGAETKLNTNIALLTVLERLIQSGRDCKERQIAKQQSPAATT